MRGLRLRLKFRISPPGGDDRQNLLDVGEPGRIERPVDLQRFVEMERGNEQRRGESLRRRAKLDVGRIEPDLPAHDLDADPVSAVDNAALQIFNFFIRA